MATTTEKVDIAGEVLLIPLDRIVADRNVRELVAEEVDAMAASIALLGQLSPATVRPEGDRFVLVFGHKRYAALSKLGRDVIRAEISNGDDEDAARAAENITSCRRRHEAINADRVVMPTWP
jgi:ParB-like chromosome segregation protein Spo0J